MLSGRGFLNLNQEKYIGNFQNTANSQGGKQGFPPK